MSKKLYSAEFWLERAEEMRTLADLMSNDDARQKMIGVAESYERIAERALARDALTSEDKNSDKNGKM